MNSTRNILAFAVSMALAGPVAAQTGTAAGDPPRGTASPAITAPAGGAPAAAGVTPAASANHELKAPRLSKLRGVNIYDDNAKKIGELKDVVVDPASGRILHAIVGIGGVMGIGDKEHAVPTKQLRVYGRSADDAAPVRVALSGSPEGMPAAEKLAKDSPHLLGSKLVGMDINDGGGKEIGEVEDLVLDLQAGEAKFALVDFEDSLGGDDKVFAIPLAELKRSQDNGKFAIDLNKETLAQRPSLAEKGLDKMDLSTQPWMTAGAGGATGATGAAGSTPAGGATTSGASGAAAGSTPAAGAGTGSSTSGGSTATGNVTPPSAGPGGTPPANSAGSSTPGAGSK